MTDRYSFKYIEKVIYSYEENLKQYLEYREELTEIEQHGDLKVQSYKAYYGVSGTYDRILDYVHRKDILERRLKRLNAEIQAVFFLENELKASTEDTDRKKYEVMKSVYLEGNGKLVEIDGIDGKEIASICRELVREVRQRLKTAMREVYGT